MADHLNEQGNDVLRIGQGPGRALGGDRRFPPLKLLLLP
jgi:hypothetical protein